MRERSAECYFVRYDAPGQEVPMVLHIPEVVTLSTSYRPKVKTIPMIVKPAYNNYCIDLGNVKSINVTFRRPNPSEVDDDGSDDRYWSNAKWIGYYRRFFDVWQNALYNDKGERSGGFRFVFRPNGAAERLHPEIDCNVFVTGAIDIPYDLVIKGASINLTAGSMLLSREKSRFTVKFAFQAPGKEMYTRGAAERERFRFPTWSEDGSGAWSADGGNTFFNEGTPYPWDTVERFAYHADDPVPSVFRPYSSTYMRSLLFDSPGALGQADLDRIGRFVGSVEGATYSILLCGAGGSNRGLSSDRPTATVTGGGGAGVLLYIPITGTMRAVTSARVGEGGTSSGNDSLAEGGPTTLSIAMATTGGRDVEYTYSAPGGGSGGQDGSRGASIQGGFGGAGGSPYQGSEESRSGRISTTPDVPQLVKGTSPVLFGGVRWRTQGPNLGQYETVLPSGGTPGVNRMLKVDGNDKVLTSVNGHAENGSGNIGHGTYGAGASGFVPYVGGPRGKGGDGFILVDEFTYSEVV